MSPEIKQILAYPYWRQSIKLSEKYATPGRVNAELWDFLKLPASLKGKSFLDVGANDGLFSFLAEQKGATKIVASDLYKEDVGSMELGWSYEGISMLKEYFHSSVKLHKGGIYQLRELQESFDVVWVNNVINWLDDIERAIENLCAVCHDTLMISDGFITEDHSTDYITPVGMPIRYMYKVSYIEKLLQKNGFEIERLNAINYERLFMYYFISYPRIVIRKGSKIYNLPHEESTYKLSDKDVTMYSFGRAGDYFQLFELGWIHKNNAEVYFHTPSLIFRILKAMGGEKLYYYFKRKFSKRRNRYSSFVITARKKV